MAQFELRLCSQIPLPARKGGVETCLMILRFVSAINALTLAIGCLTAADQPNVIVILVDDMGFSDISCYGGEIPTPNIDALAAGGMKFSQFYNTGRCSPTRASLLTGLYPHQAGMGHLDGTIHQNHPGYQGRLNENCVTIPEVLGEAGYFTAITGKWHAGQQGPDQPTPPWERGFQRSLNLPRGGLHFSDQTGPKGGTSLFLNGAQIARDDPRFNPPWYGTHLWTEWGIKFLDEAIEAKKPFFLYLAHPAPHFPCMAPEETIAKYRGKYMSGWDKLREERYARQISMGLIESNWPLTPRPEEIPAWDSLSEKDKVRYDDMMAIYAAMIEEVDTSIGTLVTGLRERDQLHNTLILFLSDNGGNAETGIRGKYKGEQPGDPHSDVFIGKCWAHLNNTPFRQYKHYNHEGGIATPLIAHWPDGIAATKEWITTPGHLVDLMATCVDLGNGSYPEHFKQHAIAPMEGKSLRPVFDGGELPERPLYFEHEGNAAVRQGEYKLVRLGRKGAWELYDMGSDRTEAHDLAAAMPEKTAKLRELWTQWAKTHQVLPYPAKKEKKKALTEKPIDPHSAFKTHDQAVHVMEYEWMRDPCIYRHGGTFMLTATRLEHTMGDSQGIEIWSSNDLINWEGLGVPWNFFRSSWLKDKEREANENGSPFWLWAPELYFIDHRWVAVHTTNKKLSNLLISDGGEYNDSYAEPFGADFGHRHDPSIFTDHDGSHWLVWGCASIARLKPDFSGFAGEEIAIGPSDRKLGHEGCTIRRIGSRYVLFGTAWSSDNPDMGTYNLYYCTSDKITGPYGPRQFAGRFCGHGTPFKDKQGRWWSTAFQNGQFESDLRKGQQLCDAGKPWTLNPQGLTLVPLDVQSTSGGDVVIRAKAAGHRSPGPEEIQKFTNLD
ncbi:MAG: arylsulfatase A-like enzyme [Verrucomicrobiales bacterium]|jgi:arylsulfatase A-like enzyme